MIESDRVDTTGRPPIPASVGEISTGGAGCDEGPMRRAQPGGNPELDDDE